jgi:hypothetical protein
MFEPGRFRLAPELAFNISIETIFLTRTYQAIRVRKTFCHRAGKGPRELGKR